MAVFSLPKDLDQVKKSLEWFFSQSRTDRGFFVCDFVCGYVIA